MMDNAHERKKLTAAQCISAVLFFIIFGVLVFLVVKFLVSEEPSSDARQRSIVASAMIAIDQYAPGTDYPETSSGWTIRENPDGTITVTSPNLGSPIYVMLIEDTPVDSGDTSFIPYFVKVEDQIVFDQSHLYDPSKQPQLVPSEDLSGDDLATIESICNILSPYFEAEDVSVSTLQGNTEISASSEAITSAVESALNTGTAPDIWHEILTFIEEVDFPLLADTPKWIFYIKSQDGRTIYMTAAKNSILYDIFNLPAAPNDPTISLDEFNQISVGMTYNEVVAIIGSSGTLISESGSDLGYDYHTTMWMWEGEGLLGANANVMFQGGVVVSKAQAGLE